jgi:hypothetical protein
VKNHNEPNIQIRSIIEIVLHPAFQRATRFDLPVCDAAILKVDRSFNFNEFVRKINLPPYGYDPPGT